MQTHAAGALPVVVARAIVDKNGVRTERAAPMYDTLPGWWNQGTEQDRTLWLNAYFRRALNLTKDEDIVSVTCDASGKESR